VYDITPTGSSGRMTGSGAVSAAGLPSWPNVGGTASADFTLRCNGSPNQFGLDWAGGSFDLTFVDQVLCWDDSRFSEAQPNAPMDSLWMQGHGTLKNGQVGTIEFTLTDQGEPGKGRDTLSFVVRNSAGTVVYRGAS